MKGTMIQRLLVPGAVLLAFGMFGTQNAQASRARDLVLGSGDGGYFLGNGNGSFYYNTEYNIFYDPASINDMTNWGVIEKSNFPGNSAQGGFAANMGSFNMGLYFNRTEAALGFPATAGATTFYNNGTGSFAASMTPIELTVGADMGVKWGIGLEYASFNGAGAAGVGSQFIVRGSVHVADFEPFAQWQPTGTNSTGGADISNKMWGAGLRYHYGEWVPYGAYFKSQVADTDSMSAFVVGLGRNTKPADMITMHYSISAVRDSTANRSILPIDFSVEADLASWLTGMAGLGYHVIDKLGGNSVGDATTGRIGFMAHAGKADFDFAVGKGIGTALESTAALNAQNFDLDNGFFSAASLAYHW